jgi:hypothetical protein
MSGAVEAKCAPSALILHAHVPSDPAVMHASTGLFPDRSAAITRKPSSLTGTLAMPSPKVEQKKRTIGSACQAAHGEAPRIMASLDAVQVSHAQALSLTLRWR